MNIFIISFLSIIIVANAILTIFLYTKVSHYEIILKNILNKIQNLYFQSNNNDYLSPQLQKIKVENFYPRLK